MEKRSLDRIDDVLYLLCRHSCNIMDCWVPYSCPIIAKQLGTSIYTVRKCMKRLVETGLAKKNSVILDREESLLSYSGFEITEKAKRTEIYKKSGKEEARICYEIFGGTLDEWEKVFLG